MIYIISSQIFLTQIDNKNVEQLDVLDEPAVNSFINVAALVTNTSGTGAITNRPDRLGLKQY